MALKEMSAQTRECSLSWNAALADVIKVKGGDEGVLDQGDPKSSDGKET